MRNGIKVRVIVVRQNAIISELYLKYLKSNYLKIEVFKLIYYLIMFIFLLFCIFQFAKGSLIFREITSGVCSDYENWNHVQNVEQCLKIHMYTHFYSIDGLMSTQQLHRVLRCGNTMRYFNSNKKLLASYNSYKRITNTELSFVQFYGSEPAADLIPYGCSQINTEMYENTVVWNSNSLSNVNSSIKQSGICVYNPPAGSYVPLFIDRYCALPTNNRGNWLPLTLKFNFDWPMLYDDTRYLDINSECASDISSCSKHSLFAQRRFGKDDMTNAWASEHHGYIYDDLYSPIPLTYCSPGYVVQQVNLKSANFKNPPGNPGGVYLSDIEDFTEQTETQCVGCPMGKYHDGRFSERGNTCAECPDGYYSDSVASPLCHECLAGYKLSADKTACTSCLSSGQVGNGDTCEDCPVGKKTLDGVNCIWDSSYCEVGYRIISSGSGNSTSCQPLPKNNILTTSINRFVSRIQSIPEGNDNADVSRMSKQLMKELVCDTIKLDYQDRLAETFNSHTALRLPTIDVYPNYNVCQGPTRHLKLNGICQIEYENEIMDSFRFEAKHMLTESNHDIYDALKARTNISVEDADCQLAMPNCSATRLTNCKCGAAVCKSNDYTICSAGACDYIGPEFRLSVNKSIGLEHLSKGECEQFFQKYDETYKIGRFIVGTISARPSNGESVVIYDDGENVAYRDAVDNTATIIPPTMKCKMSRGDVIFGPDLNGWYILLRLRTDNSPIRGYAELSNAAIVYKTTVSTCEHNQLSSDCWCVNSDYCTNKYCVFGKCEDSPLCESELGETPASQNCTCGDETCTTNQFCMNGQCLDQLFCPNSDGLGNITDTCQCGSNVCTPGQACQSGECLPAPRCPNTNGFQQVLSRCSCGSNVCSKDQYCSNGVCLNDSPCIGYGDKTILEPEQCGCGSNTCSQNQICYEGNCLEPTELACKTDGIHSYNTSCQCGAQTCGPSQFCYFDTCFDNPVCPAGGSFQGLCHNGVRSLYDSECTLGPGQFGYCSNPKLLNRLTCERTNTWGYCSDASMLTRNDCLKRCTGKGLNETNCLTPRQLNIICDSEPCFVDKTPIYGQNGEYIGCNTNGTTLDNSEEDCETTEPELTCVDKQTNEVYGLNGAELTREQYERLISMSVSAIDNVTRQNYENTYGEALLAEHPCLQQYGVLPENIWTKKCTNPLLLTSDECRRTNHYNQKCSVEGIESPAQCRFITTRRSELCSCNLFSNNVEECGLGQICENNKCEDVLCNTDNFKPLGLHCKCGNTMCPKGHICNENEICNVLPLCGFHQHDSSPGNNINCLCSFDIECESNDILEPCTADSCNNQTQS